jgi:poly(hydroxyalkanoate) granule-associated protein
MSEKKDIKDIQNELKESASKIWLAGLGALAAAEEEGSKLFKTLVERGEKWESKGRRTVQDMGAEVKEKVEDAKEKAASTWDQMGDKFDDALASALKRFGVPAREEIATLTRRVEELTALVESLKQPKKAAKAAEAPKEA